MARFIHARRIDGAIQYRIWCTITDSYLTEPMTRNETVAWLTEEARALAARTLAADLQAIDGRIARADTTGSSFRREDAVTLTEPWDTERCAVCRFFHHGFVATAKGSKCADCGEPKGDRSHGPACEPKGTVEQ